MTNTQKALLYIIRLGLQNEPDKDFPNSVDWGFLFKMSIQHGVNAIVADGLQLHKEIQIPQEFKVQKLQWLGTIMQMERRYEKQNQIVDNLTSYLQKQCIDIMILKGQPLSFYYPNPNHRPVGDIDIFAFGDYEKINQLIESHGEHVEYENDKHSVFYFNGVMVENHQTLFDISHSKIEKITESFIAKDKKSNILTKKGFYIPNPQCNYLFLLRHLAKHFGDNEGINLRQLIDFGLFLYNNKKNIDIKLAKKVLFSTKLTKINNIFVSIAQEITGHDLSVFIWGQIDHKIKNKVFDEIFYHPINETNTIGFAYFFEKIKIIFSQKWKYDLLPESFFSRIRRAWRKM